MDRADLGPGARRRHATSPRPSDLHQLADYRRTDVGFVFQFYNLVPNLTARENVELASQIVEHAEDPSRALSDVGLAHRENNFPAQLSGGEQQRVAIARAVAKNPKLLLCDEPTGALDYKTGKQILALLQEMCHREGITVIIVTHNSALAPMADRLVRFEQRQGRRDARQPQPRARGTDRVVGERTWARRRAGASGQRAQAHRRPAIGAQQTLTDTTRWQAGPL